MSHAVTEHLDLKVAEAQQKDIGKGMVRIGREQIRALGLQSGDVVAVEGKRLTAAVAVPAAPEDEGLDLIRLDGLSRWNARTGIGENVRVQKAEWKEARRLVLAPAKAGLRIEGTGDALRPTLLLRPVVYGDLISTSILREPRSAFVQDRFPEEFFHNFFESPAYGLMEIRLVVVATTPKGIVRVTEETEIELVPEHVEAKEVVDHAEVTYDDLGGLKPVIGKVREMVELPLKHPELFDRLGIEPPRGVVVIGASNRPDLIDPALLRPGRFDEMVYVPVGDRLSRIAIFAAHLRRMKLDPGVVPEKLAEVTENFTGADIAGVCQKAGLYALRENPDAHEVTLEHFLRAIQDTVPSVTEAMVEEYDKLAKRMKQDQVRIGFVPRAEK